MLGRSRICCKRQACDFRRFGARLTCDVGTKGYVVLWRAAGRKEIITGSLDKTMTLWRLQVSCHNLLLVVCQFVTPQKQIVCYLLTAGAHVCISWLLVQGCSDDREERAATCSTSAVEEVVTLTPSGAPIFSLAVDGAAPSGVSPDERQQV